MGPGDKTRGNRHKLKYEEFCLNMRENFFTVRETEHWNRLPRGIVEFAFLEILSHLDTILNNVL